MSPFAESGRLVHEPGHARAAPHGRCAVSPPLLNAVRIMSGAWATLSAALAHNWTSLALMNVTYAAVHRCVSKAR